MKNKNYKVCRDNIFVGQVISTDKIYRYSKKYRYYDDKSNGLVTGVYSIYRSILFTLDENKFASDLLYQSPNYPILNLTNDDICLNLEGNKTIVNDYINLSELLKYYKYNEELTYNDILRIRERFFNSKFVKDNCELFGVKETTSKELTIFTDFRDIKETNIIKSRQQQIGKRTFVSGFEHELSEEYWNILNATSDNTVYEVLSGYDKKRNAFTPHKKEGKIKKLVK